MNTTTLKTLSFLGLILLVGCQSNTTPPPPKSTGQATVNLVLPAGVISQGQEMAAIPGEFIVTFQSKSDVHKLNVQKLKTARVLAGSIDTTEVLMKASSAAELQALPGVLRVQPNYRYQKLAVPNDPYLSGPWNPEDPLSAQWYLNQIGAPGAWNDKGTTTKIKVAVLDDGYTKHEDLNLAHLDLQPIGCNTSTGDRCLNPADRNDDPYYTWPHLGSHSMSIISLIAAQTNNNKGMASLNFNGNGQAPLQVMPISIYDREGNSSTSIIARGIRTAILKGAKVINLSLCLSSGGVCSRAVSDPVLDQALREARDAGVVVTASAGNYNLPYVAYPANNINVVSVGATDVNLNRANFSHYGGRLRLMAPGHNLLVFDANVDAERTVQTDYTTNSGTSFSAPIVAAAAGLLYSKRPNATWNQVVGALVASGDPLTDPLLTDVKFLRVDKALALITGNPPAPPALRGTYEANAQISGASVINPIPFDYKASVVNVIFNQTLSVGEHTVNATIRDRHQPDQTLYTCQGTFTVLKDDLVTRDIQCK